MRTASSLARRGLTVLAGLVALGLLATQTTALAHEIEHVLHLHAAPCALHTAADQLVMASTPEPAPAVPFVASSRVDPRPVDPWLAPPGQPSPARAPPHLS
jgi:hypothetical protein